MKVPQPDYYPPAAHSYVRCHRCNETVIDKEGVLLGVDDHGAWTRHQHQPEGLHVTAAQHRAFSSIKDKRPLTRQDFES